MTIKEKAENHPVIWMLSLLLTGFLAGTATYNAILEIAKMQVVSENARILKDEEISISKQKLNDFNKINEKNNSLNNTLNKFKKDFDALKEKEHFVSLYVRYLIAKKSNNPNELKDAENALSVQVINLKKKPISDTYEIYTNQVSIGKGIYQSTIKFVYDQSIWPLPKPVSKISNTGIIHLKQSKVEGIINSHQINIDDFYPKR